MLASMRALPLFLLSSVALTPQSMVAQTAPASNRIAFDIPAQPLDAALAAYFQASGVPLLYDSGLAAGRRSAAVRGTFSPREALRRLLGGTGLVARYTRSDAVVIAVEAGNAPEGVAAPIPLGRVVVRARAAPPISAPDRSLYYRALSESVRTILSTDRRTAHRAFDLLVGLRLAEDGVVRQVRIQRGTGDPATDLLVTQVLSGAALPRPPKGLAQPLSLAVKGRRPPR